MAIRRLSSGELRKLDTGKRRVRNSGPGGTAFLRADIQKVKNFPFYCTAIFQKAISGSTTPLKGINFLFLMF